MNRYHESVAVAIAIAVVLVTLIISITVHEMHEDDLKAQEQTQTSMNQEAG